MMYEFERNLNFCSRLLIFTILIYFIFIISVLFINNSNKKSDNDYYCKCCNSVVNSI